MGKETIAVVTGASRGAGKGIAIALGAAGMTVYVTGRTTVEGGAPLPGTVFRTAEEINDAGGAAIPVICDHGDDTQVKALFERIAAEQGRIDILVNNALKVPESLIQLGPFWEKPLDLIDLLDVGLRSTYVSSWYAAPLLLAGNHSLVVNSSSFGGGCYMHGPAYGAGKAGTDKMAHDMAIDFRPHDVCVVSMWMALLKTERTIARAAEDPDHFGARVAKAETPNLVGRVIEALYRDPARMEKSGKIVIAAELARDYGLIESDGAQPVSQRDFLGAPREFNPAIIA